MTLKELVDLYVRWQQQHNRAQTAYNADMHCRTLLKLIGDDAIVSRLDEHVVSDALASTNPVTFNERLRRLKSLLRWAYAEGYIADIAYLSKVRRAKAPSTRVRDAEKYLEHDEIATIFVAMDGQPRWQYLTRLLILTGCRVGEALALTIDDIEGDTIRIDKTLNPNGGGLQMQTKTDASTRSISVQDELRELLDELDSWREQQQELHGHASRILIPAPDGGHCSYAAYCKYLRELSERTIGRRITPHALRHTHTALLAEAGMSLDSISRRLGHADSKITREVYMHVTERMRERDAEQLRSIRLIDS